ncbi:MAG TPA: M42 family metallopeptidase [Limnochordales bacterium]
MTAMQGEAPARDSLAEAIRRLAELVGPSGREEAVREAIREQLSELADRVWSDPLGNLFARREASRQGGAGGRRVMVTAHMDEVGIMVTHIDEKGFLRFAPVGGLSPSLLVGQHVRFVGGVTGVVGREPEEEGKDLRHGQLFVDIGVNSAEEANRLVQVGDAACLWRPVQRLGQRLSGKAMDDRVGCVVVLEALRRLAESPHEVVAVFTVQEEVGTRGARPAAFQVAPELALAVDVTPAADTPKARPLPVALGKGVAIKVKDNSVISHPGVRRWMVEVAERHGIPHQLEVLDFGGTDAGAIHTTREGVPSGVLSIPTRYLHTPAETVDLEDVEAAVKLLVRLLQEPAPF